MKIENTFTLNGIAYTQAKSGYCYKFAGLNGQRAGLRISKREFQKAAERYIKSTVYTEERIEKAMEQVEEEEQNLFNEEYQARKEAEEVERQSREAADRQTESTFNGKSGKATGEAKKKAAPKPVREKPSQKKATKKPGAAWKASFDGEEVTLTEKQVDFIKHLPDTHFWENGVDSVLWIDCLCDDIGGQFEEKPMTVGAMISTLCEKGLGMRAKQKVNGKKAISFELTEKGKAVAYKLGL